MRLILLGAPGAGKGTQGLRLAGHYGVAHVSSGDILREHVAEGTELGRRIAGHVAAGELVPDELVLSVIGRAVAEAMETGGYLLDGFPRTLAQAERAYEGATRANVAAHAVLYLQVPDEVAEQRLRDRAATSGRVDDASPEVIHHRLEVFHAQTVPLLDYYRELERLVTIDATPPPDEVAAEIIAAVDAKVGDQVT
ncbi:MAG TPA: adenylate kinase [Acidimicrobiales bacterium]|nr:adenylate kinase [Acidimicrobiales bacterium]